MKALSQASKYGIRALIYLAAKPQTGTYFNIKEISDELGISFHFLTRIFRELTGNGILVSYRGPSGGVALAKAARKITLIDIVIALEGADYFDQCLLGLPGCGSAKPCPTHNFWTVVKSKIKEHLSSTTIAELVEKVKSDEVRLYQ